jgi:hypothetical protein
VLLIKENLGVVPHVITAVHVALNHATVKILKKVNVHVCVEKKDNKN